MPTNYNDQLTANNAKIDSIKAKVDALPERKPEQAYNKTYTANGDYPVTPDPGKVITGGTIKVDVPSKTPVIKPKTITENGTFNAADEGADGYSPVTVNVPTGGGDNSLLISIVDRTVKTIDTDAITSIGIYAFYGCYNLKSVTLPAATSLGNSAFGHCTSLASVTLPAATSISNSAFGHCTSLASVTLPAATSISGYAFYNCNALTSVTLPGSTLCVATGDLKIPSGCKIYVPANLLEQYKVATNWAKYAAQFVAIA